MLTSTPLRGATMSLQIPVPTSFLAAVWFGMGLTFGRGFGKNMDQTIKKTKWFQTLPTGSSGSSRGSWMLPITGGWAPSSWYTLQLRRFSGSAPDSSLTTCLMFQDASDLYSSSYRPSPLTCFSHFFFNYFVSKEN